MTALDILYALREDAIDVQNHIVADVMPDGIDGMMCAIEALIADEEFKTLEAAAKPIGLRVVTPGKPYSITNLEDIAAHACGFAIAGQETE